MNEQDIATRVSALLSRGAVLKGAAVGAAGVTLAQAGLFRALAAESESVQRILDITATIERFGVTFLGAGIESAQQKNFNKPIPAPVLAIVRRRSTSTSPSSSARGDGPSWRPSRSRPRP